MTTDRQLLFSPLRLVERAKTIEGFDTIYDNCNDKPPLKDVIILGVKLGVHITTTKKPDCAAEYANV